MSADRPDLVVVGGGVFGLATALEAAGRGLDVVVLDRGRFPDPTAASVGPSRKLRSTYLEPGYSELVVEAMAAWERLERDTDTTILLRLGNLVYSVHDEHPTLDAFQAASERAGGTIERLDAAELRARFPHFRRARAAIFEPAAGMLRATVGTGAIRTMAMRAGVTILEDAPVARLDLDGPDPAAVLADGRRMRAPRMVVAAGAWTAGLVPELRPAITLKAQGLAYLHDLPASFDAGGFPPFSELETIFYGFPAWGDDPVKIGWHQYGEVTDDPDTPRDEASPTFLAGVRRFLDEHLGLKLGPDAIEGATCLYDLTPTTDFVVDRLPGHPAVLVATGGSGHAFKFGPVLGRIAMDRLDGTGDSWLPAFAWPAAATHLALAPVAAPPAPSAPAGPR